jgi:WD40 repeat protein
LDTVLQVLDQEPSRPVSLNPDVDRDLETICLKCLEKEPSRRYDSAAALADDLEHWLRGEPIQARPSSLRERTLKWARRRPALAALLGVSAASALSLLVLLAFLGQNIAQRAAMVENLETARKDLNTAQDERALTLAETHAAQEKARRIRYDADMQFAHAAWKANNVQGLLSLLEAHRPSDGQEDWRGFEWHYLWRLCHGERLSWQGHTLSSDMPIPGAQIPVLLAFSPDGKTLASTSLDKQIKLWDSATGNQIRALSVADAIASVAFTCDGRCLRLVVPGKERPEMAKARTQRLLTSATGKASPSLAGLCDAFAFQSLSLDGRQSTPTELFDPAQLPAPLSMIAGGPEAISAAVTGCISLKGQMISPGCLALSPDRKTLAIGGISIPILQPGAKQEGAVLLWDLVAGKELAVLKEHDSPVIAVAFAPDGRMLVSAAFDKTIRWDLAAGGEKPTLRSEAAPVVSLAFSRDGKTLISGSGNGTVKLRHADTGQIQTEFIGHENRVTSVALAPDGRTLASASADGIIKLWDPTAAQGPTRTPLKRGALALTCSPEGQVVVLDQGGVLHVLDLLTNCEQRALPLEKGSRTLCWRGGITPDGKTTAIADLQTVWLVDSISGKEHHHLTQSDGLVYTLAFSPDGKILAVGRGSSPTSGEVVLWDVATGTQRATWKGHRGQVVSLAFSPDGKRLASGSLEQTVKVWDVDEGKEVLTIQGHNKGISAVVYSRDGTKLATAGGDHLSIRDAATGKELQTIPLYSHHVVSMAFSPNGARMATAAGIDDEGPPLASRVGGAKIWDLATGQEVLGLGDSTDLVTHIAFSPDGRRLVASRAIGSEFSALTGGASGELLIWNASPTDVAETLSGADANRR